MRTNSLFNYFSNESLRIRRSSKVAAPPTAAIPPPGVEASPSALLLCGMSRVHYQDAKSHPPSTSSSETPVELSEASILKATSSRRSKTPTPADATVAEDEADVAAAEVAADLQRKGSKGFSQLLRRKSSHVRGQRRERVKMVGQQLQDQLHHAFRGWFKDVSGREYSIQSGR